MQTLFQVPARIFADFRLSYLQARLPNTLAVQGFPKTQEGDNPPIGIVLGAYKDKLLMEYATQGIENNLFVSKYQLYLPNKQELQSELEKLLEDESNQGGGK